MHTRPTAIINTVQAAAAAFQFLSRIPVPFNVPFNETVLRRSVVFFPAVGGAIGLILAGAGYALSGILPPLAAAAILTAVWVAVTGGLHLDGLMDTADGILSHRSRERMLEIMKDSRVGAMGAIACSLQLLLKFAFIASLLPEGRWSWKAAALLAAAPVWSRWFMAVAIASWPSARAGQGLGSMFQGVAPKHLLAASLTAASLSAAIQLLLGTPFRDAVVQTAGAAFVTGLLGAAAASWMARKLGGLTGDTYGALNEMTETALLLGAMIFLGR